MYVVKRSQHNPILSPDEHIPWEAYATFNPCPIKVQSTVHLVYRAINRPEPFENTQFIKSVIGKAESKDGVRFSKKKVFIEPTELWDRYGCEDPRVTKVGNKYYIFYTALSAFPFTANGIKVGLAISSDMQTIDEKHLITPFNAKAMTLFPEKINGKFTAILSAHTDMPPSKTAIIQFEREEDMWSEKYWNTWLKTVDEKVVKLKVSDNERIEIGAPPIKTKYGWLLVFSRVQNYYSENKIFGIEAALLDLKDPRKIIGRTRGPLFVPEASYEKSGIVPNIIFPSGALVDGDYLNIYYGGADTVCGMASVYLPQLLGKISGKKVSTFTRSLHNPILKPTNNFWENKSVCNPAALELDNKIHLLYRAISTNNTSTFGYASTRDGAVIIERSKNPVYLPREPFERKGIPNGNSGCEDARMTLIGKMIYMCYTAYNGIEPPAVALTSISRDDFIAKRWDWSKPMLISPPGIDDKDACILPFFNKDKKIFFIHRIDHTIVGNYINLDNPGRSTDRTTIMAPRPGMWDSKKIGLSAPPLKTKYGWLMVYHGISDSNKYRVGLALLDLKDPTRVISRTSDFVFEPRENYEGEGLVPNVVFPCGAVIRKNKLLVYYGAADKVIGLAEATLEDILNTLLK